VARGGSRGSGVFASRLLTVSFGGVFLVFARGVRIPMFTVSLSGGTVAAMGVGHHGLSGDGMTLAGAESEGQSGEGEGKNSGHRAGGG